MHFRRFISSHQLTEVGPSVGWPAGGLGGGEIFTGADSTTLTNRWSDGPSEIWEEVTQVIDGAVDYLVDRGSKQAE